MTDSHYWTRRPHILGGIGLSVLFLSISSIADNPGLDSTKPVSLFLTIISAGAFATLIVGFVYLGRLWKDFFAAVKGRDSADPEGEALTSIGLPLLKHSVWVFTGLALFVSSLEKIGWRIPFSNPIVQDIYSHTLWFAIAAILILVWTSKNPIVMLLRFALILLFTGTTLTGAVLFFWAATSATAPAFVVLQAGIVALNFVFFYLIERRAQPSNGIPN